MKKSYMWRLKKVCNIMPLPRIFRADLGSHCKFTRQAVPLVLNRQTNLYSTSNDSDDRCERCRKLIQLCFGPSEYSEKSSDIADAEEKQVLPQSNKEVYDRINDIRFRSDNSEHTYHPKSILVEPVSHSQGVTNFTTAKLNNEKLKQRDEDIEEIASAETEKSYLNDTWDQWNIKPNILGNSSNDTEPMRNHSRKSIVSNPKFIGNMQETIDRISERILKSQSGNIDERILKEMEKLGVPQPGIKSSAKTSMGPDVQVVLKKPRKPTQKPENELHERSLEKDLLEFNRINSNFEQESDELKQESDQAKAYYSDMLYSNFVWKEPGLYKSYSAKVETEESIHMTSNIVKTVTPDNVDNIMPLIDPYDKSSIRTENDECEYGPLPPLVANTNNAIKASDYKEPKRLNLSMFTSPVFAEDTIRFKEIKLNVATDDQLENENTVANAKLLDVTNNVMGLEDIHVMEPIPVSISRKPLSSTEKHTFKPVNTLKTESVRNETSDVTQSESCDKIMALPLADTKSFVGLVLEKTLPTENIYEIVTTPVLGTTENVPLSELLRRVRERNGMEQCQKFIIKLQDTETQPLEGKCGDKKPVCPPPAPICPPPAPTCPRPPRVCPPPAPVCPPPPPVNPPSPPVCPPPPPVCPKPPPVCPPKPSPPAPCPTSPPRCPKPCKPICPSPCPSKNPCSKCEPCQETARDKLWEFLPKILSINSKNSFLPLLVSKTADPDAESNVMNETPVSSNIWEKVQIYGNSLRSLYFCTLTEDSCQLARDFEPWCPIPSWPIPKKEMKKELVCPKDGCKIPPPLKLHEPCRKDDPCSSFPKLKFVRVEDVEFHFENI